MTQTLQSSEKPKRITSPITLRHIALVSVAVGIFITSYLSYTKFTAVPVACVVGGSFDCGTVTNSSWSELAGIPIAYLGLFMYLTVGALLLLEPRTDFFRENVPLLTFSIGVLAWAYSMFLVYLQFFVLQTLCSWCLSHEANMTVLFALLIARFWQSLQIEDET